MSEGEDGKMGQMPTLADLNETIAGREPRVRDLELAEWLGFERQRDIRQLIERNLEELGTHGGVVVAPIGGGGLRYGAANPPRKGGRPGLEYWLNEQQALLICMFSRTAEAAAVRKQVIDLYVAWRRGQVPASPMVQPPGVATPPPLSEQERNRVRWWEAERDKMLAAASAYDQRIRDVIEQAQNIARWEAEAEAERLARVEQYRLTDGRDQ
jgi:hypothetical protein